MRWSELVRSRYSKGVECVEMVRSRFGIMMGACLIDRIACWRALDIAIGTAREIL